MKGLKKLAVMALLVAAAGWSATTQAAPMLPMPFMFYSSTRNMAAFHTSVGFHMYFINWRQFDSSWSAQNIQFATVVQGKKLNLPLPTPWKIAKDNKNTGGWTSPVNPWKDTWPVRVPEPTGIAAIAGATLLLARRKREA